MMECDVDGLERATVSAVAPEVLEELPGWLLPMDSGTVGRARSAVPLSHPKTNQDQTTQLAQLSQIEDIYFCQGRQPAFRLPDIATHLHAALGVKGYQRTEPSLVMVGNISDLARTPVSAHSRVAPVQILVRHQATPDWAAVFLGPGFDPADGQHRIRNLSRATGTVFVCAQVHGETVACGVGSFGHGWLGVHGLRTARAHRGRGFARDVLRSLALLAHGQNVERVFLQVGAGNASAQALYRTAGLSLAWPYAYWRCED